MSVPKEFTPLPVADLAPIQVEIPDWHDLNANSSHQVLEHNRFQDQVIDVQKIGGRPETNVTVEVTAEFADKSGGRSETIEAESTAFGNFNFPLDREDAGPIATNRLEWRTVNRSGTGFTDADGDPYQTFLGYAIRPMTVVEKLRRAIPLTDAERRLANRQFPGMTTSVRDMVDLNIPPEEDPAFRANLEGKNVIEEDSTTSTVDISSTGVGNAVDIVDERVRNDPETGLPADIIYLKQIGINSAEFAEDDALRLRIVRDGTEDFARLKTFGFPGIGDGTGVGGIAGNTDGVSFPPYVSDWHVPFPNRMTIQVFNQSGGNASSNVDVRVEWARVERTLVEKALYGLESEIRSDDDLAEARTRLYQQIRDKLRLGIPLDPERREQENMQSQAPTR